jgi:hypothetical protein
MASLVARPDGNPETSTFDGYASYDDAGDTTWAAVRGAANANTTNDSAVTMTAYLTNADAAGTWNGIARVICGFDTSSLGAGATITAATLQFRTSSGPIDELTQAVNISTITAPASPTAIATGDYNVTKYGSTKLCDTDLALAGVVTDTDYPFTLNASGLTAISKTGITWLALRIVTDITNTEPGTNPGGFLSSSITIHSAEAATEAHRPVLTVTFTPAASGSPGCVAAIFPAIRRRRDF